MSKSKVEDFYNSHAEQEWERLDRHRTEFAVTVKAFEEYLPAPPFEILDIGGGPGRYAFALSQRGYSVTLLDLAEQNLALAGRKVGELDIPLKKIVRGNALKLDRFADQTYDAVLLQGPLYHLLTHAERVTAIVEAKRVLKPGGLVFAAFITRYAVFRDGSVKYPLEVFDKQKEWEQLWQDGINFGGESFTDAYFAMPEEIIPLMEEQGFNTVNMLGVEGITAGHEDSVNNLDGEAWQFWVEKNYQFAKDPALRAAADHLLYIGTKP